MQYSPSREVYTIANKFPAIYGTRRSITMFTTVPIVNQINQIHSLQPYSPKIHFNIASL
jgi:hypothetical protein